MPLKWAKIVCLAVFPNFFVFHSVVCVYYHLVPFITRKRFAVTFVVATALLLGAFFLIAFNCPPTGIGFTQAVRDLHRLKNRTARPQESDFDDRVTLLSLSQPGDDTARWTATRAARIEGYVVAVAAARPESTNCYWGCDTHIHIAARPDAPPREHMVLEVTPHLAAWARSQGLDWSVATLTRDLTGRWVRFEGWLMFDSGHAMESENIVPGRESNWRVTAWEIHPVTKIEVIK